jgi:hypothetical protein
MFYQESGQFSTRYRQDGRALRLWQQRAALWALLRWPSACCPFIGNDYWFSAILIPFLVLSLAGLGLNLLTGYAGQLSLGSAAFMAVGAFASYKLQFLLPGLPLLLSFVAGGVVAAAVGVVFGLPSLRIKGFYLLVSTLAAQFLSNGCSPSLPGSPTVTSPASSPRRRCWWPVTIWQPGRALPAHPERGAAPVCAGGQSGTQQPGPQLDGGARHGHRRRGDRHPHPAHQIAGLCHQLFHPGGGRFAVGVYLSGHGGAAWL